MEEVTSLELCMLDGGVNGYAAAALGVSATLGCLASGGAAFGPWGWAGCALGGALIGAGTYIL